MTDYEPLAALSDIHAKRGYLLSHHGLMAISAPHLPERYDSLYYGSSIERAKAPAILFSRIDVTLPNGQG